VNSEVEEKKVRQNSECKKSHLTHPRRKAIFKSKLVRSIRGAHANLTRISEFEFEDIKNQIQLGGL
jgi:hypothetical protein